MKRLQSNPPAGNYTAKSELPGRNASIWQRIAGAWVRLTGPDANRFDVSISDQERLRRSRLLCALFPLIPFAVLANLPIALTKPVYWITLTTLCLLSIVSIIMNRRGNVTASGFLFIGGVDLTLVVVMVTQPHGIRNGNIPDFDLFVLTLLIAGIVLPRITLPFLAIANCLIIFAIFTIVPHDPLLTQEILLNQKGLAYAELIDAFLLQIAGATIAYLSSWSVWRALTRANVAEELAAARARINEQDQRALEQKRGLEYGINVLKETQARVANGDYSARARLQDNELAPLAISFNLLTERLSKIPRLERDYQRMEVAIQQFLEMRTSSLYGKPLPPFQPTGTIADYLYPMVERSVNQIQMVSQSSTGVEKIVSSLQQQSTEVMRLDGVLLQVRPLVQHLRHESASFARRLSRTATREQKSTGYLQSSQQPLPSPDELNAPLSTLLEEATQRCNRVGELGKQALQEAKQVASSLRNS